MTSGYFEYFYKLIQENKIKFFHTSFREYCGVFGDYIIKVNPFNTQIIKNNSVLSVENINYHHVDFNEGRIAIDPCDIFEMVSGYRLHTGVISSEELNIINLDHSEEIKLFELEIVLQRRDNQLNQLGI